ncbi:TetR/AcrR family transcriptional regulator [Microterricola viridarii]|uniref:DNA-binding transcriptional regulator, AcrR family n=1 Tax=Microterricola viridarii TaxID=412690 RepID=A0A1H1YDX9_9MICO|nr:TetR/AcrR family transcriptional regulator [Microterricola viridarii]SDT19622.1 DNA-binding transcriptional regulator, AcrR family [Microterricola viridarii]
MSNKADAARLTPDGRREQILRVAARHFGRDGFEAVSVRDIAEQAGVTRALVYHYFPGKDALLDAVLRREAEVLLAATAPDPVLSPRENLERALGAYLDHFAASGGGLRELYVPRASAPAVVHEIAASNHAVQLERVVEFLGVDDTPLARLAIGGWLGFVEQVAAASSTAGGVDRDAVTRLCLQALAAVTGAAAVGH